MNVLSRTTAALALVVALSASGQATVATVPTPLSQLLAEAEANNPLNSAADHEARAAHEVVSQVTALPDPKFTYQQLSVGSPKPFAGYTNSDFAYVGVGASQELPYPGKLRLRGEVAQRDAEIMQAEVEVTHNVIADAVKEAYLHLAYLQETGSILRQSEDLLDQVLHDALVYYQVGQGMQQDVLRAQVNRTKLVRDITMHDQEVGRLEAHLKELLGRDQGSTDIVAEALIESPLQSTSADLLASLRQNNSEVHADESLIRKEEAQLSSARRDRLPDFELGYIYENTDHRYRDYYMFTLDLRFPRRKRINAEIVEATEKGAASRKTLDAHLQQHLAEAQQDYVRAKSDAEVLKEYRLGLIPQSDALYRTTLSAYGSDRGELAQVLLSMENILNLKLEYAQTLEDHEAALAHLEALTGASLR